MKRLAAAVVAFAALAAQSAEYLVAPLISDKLTIANANLATGSSLDRNEYQVIPTPQLPFDDAIQKIVVDAVSKVDPSATFKSLAFREGLPGAEDRDTLKETAGKLAKVLSGQVKPGEKQWIIAFVPMRGEPRMRLSNSTVGHGKVSGVGYYIDRQMRLKRQDTGEADRGFLGAFANFTIVVVDPASGAIATQREVQEGVVRGMAGSGKDHPWDVISAEDKVRLVNGLVAREVRKAMPEVLAGAGLK